MLYWVFTEAQLKAALDAYRARRVAADRKPVAGTNDEIDTIRMFLGSPEATEHKLRIEDKTR